MFQRPTLRPEQHRLDGRETGNASVVSTGTGGGGVRVSCGGDGWWGEVVALSTSSQYFTDAIKPLSQSRRWGCVTTWPSHLENLSFGLAAHYTDDGDMKPVAPPRARRCNTPLLPRQPLRRLFRLPSHGSSMLKALHLLEVHRFGSDTTC